MIYDNWLSGREAFYLEDSFREYCKDMHESLVAMEFRLYSSIWGEMQSPMAESNISIDQVIAAAFQRYVFVVDDEDEEDEDAL